MYINIVVHLIILLFYRDLYYFNIYFNSLQWTEYQKHGHIYEIVSEDAILNIGGDISLPLRQTKKHGIDVNT